MPARKKSSASKKVSKKRVSTREPKTIIKRKKATSRKAKTAKSPAKRTRATSEKVKPTITGSDAKVAARIVKERDAGTSWPKIRQMTGLGGMKIRKLYAEASGKDWESSGAKKSTAKRSGKKASASKKATTKRSRKTATAKSSAKKSGAKKAGRSKKGRRASQREGAMKLLRDVVWDSDTTVPDLKKALEGRTITIEREGLRPMTQVVKRVKATKLHDREGRVIEYTNAEEQRHFVSTREITALSA